MKIFSGELTNRITTMSPYEEALELVYMFFYSNDIEESEEILDILKLNLDVTLKERKARDGHTDR